MEIGISTASLFLKADNDVAMQLFADWNIPVAEIFLSTFSEYTKEFGTLLYEKSRGVTKVHSVHVLGTSFEPQLYNRHPKVRKDAYDILDLAMQAGEAFHAKYYTFHGVARMKKTPLTMNYEKIGADTQQIMDVCQKHGILLSYENVHWAYYNAPGFFQEVLSRVPNLTGTLDIKQARQSGFSYLEYLKEMGNRIVTVHLSDYDENGKIVLPGKGIFDFERLFSELKDCGFDGACLIEVYPEDYSSYEDLKASLSFLKELACRVFG